MILVLPSDKAIATGSDIVLYERNRKPLILCPISVYASDWLKLIGCFVAFTAGWTRLACHVGLSASTSFSKQ